MRVVTGTFFQWLTVLANIVCLYPCNENTNHKSVTSAEVVANAFMHNVVCLFGVPKTVVSDRDRRFTSKFWQKLLESLGIKCKMSTAYHP